jgi:choline-sulfatase
VATLFFGLLGLIALGFCYLEPVKTARIIRQTRSWTKGLRANAVERKATTTDYRSVVLRGNYPQENRDSTRARYVHSRLMDLGHELESKSSIQAVSVYLDGQRRHALAGTPPLEFSYQVRVPDDGRLWLGINHDESRPYDGQLNFEVLVSSTAGIENVYHAGLASKQQGWNDASIDLGAFSGRDVRIQFKTSLQGSSRESIRVYWSDLLLRSTTESREKPNLFLILIDTLRADHLGSYGYARPTSPNIDELARKGVRFDRAYSAASWTNPSILALFTGLYPSDAWEPQEHKEAIKLAVPWDVDTIAEILSVNGYLTMAASDHPGINHELFGQGFDIYLNLLHVDGPWSEWRETDSEKVLKQLHTLLEGRPDQRLFTYIHLIYPHQPYEPPPPYDDCFGRGSLRIRPDNRASVINMYDGDIRHADEVIKEIIADIQAQGLGKDSVVVLLSDHGEGFWEHGLWEHGNSLYNELLHIPLVFYAPGRIPENKTIRDLVRSIDILPTVLDLVGIEYDENNFRGRSLLPLMKDGQDDRKRLAFSEFPHSKIVFGRSIQSLTEKLIDPGQDDRMPEYYDTVEDPGELNDLGSSKSSSVADLLATIDNISRAASKSRVTHPPVLQEPSEDTIKRLKSLGYTQ